MILQPKKRAFPHGNNVVSGIGAQKAPVRHRDGGFGDGNELASLVSAAAGEIRSAHRCIVAENSAAGSMARQVRRPYRASWLRLVLAGTRRELAKDTGQLGVRGQAALADDFDRMGLAQPVEQRAGGCVGASTTAWIARRRHKDEMGFGAIVTLANPRISSRELRRHVGCRPAQRQRLGSQPTFQHIKVQQALRSGKGIESRPF